MVTGSDRSPVLNHDAHKLRQYLAARRAGDVAGARRWWDELVRDNFDRIRAMIILRGRGHLSAVEQDEALQRALIKLSNNMIHTFNGSSMGEWVNAAKTLVANVCIDTQRSERAASRREAPLHATNRGGAQTAQLNRIAIEAIERRHEEEQASAREAEDDARARQFLDWAIPQLSPKRRSVVELDRDNVPCEQIEQRLGVSRDVVYASRSRALKDLARLRKEYWP